MRMVSTRGHGIVDYIVGILLIISLWLFNFDQGGAETWIPVILGIGAIAYSLMRGYELGAFRALPMTTHLWLGGLAGLFLAISPWLFNFADFVFLPHLIIGIAEIGMALITQTVSSTYIAHHEMHMGN